MAAFDEVFQDVLCWILLVISGFIPCENITSVLAIAFISYDAVYRSTAYSGDDVGTLLIHTDMFSFFCGCFGCVLFLE